MNEVVNEKPVEVVIGLVRDGGKILIAERPPGRSLAGLWEFPGGKVEKNESYLDALKRELAEEIGINLITAHHVMTFTHRYTLSLIQLSVWEVDAYLGSPHGKESQLIQWIDLADLQDYTFPQGNQQIIAYLQSELTSDSID